jgi:hypothetical protein
MIPSSLLEGKKASLSTSRSSTELRKYMASEWNDKIILVAEEEKTIGPKKVSSRPNWDSLVNLLHIFVR